MHHLFARSDDARRLLMVLGVSVVELRGLVLVVADTERGCLLHGAEAERYLRAHRRLQPVLRQLSTGAVSPRLLAHAGIDEDRADALCQAMLDAELLTVAAAAAPLPGWALVPRWHRRLRAAVAANIRAGCLTGWQPYEPTGGNPVEVVRALVWDFFCGPAALLSQSAERFEGALSYGALAEAAAWFPPAGDHDDPHCRYLLAAGRRRRVAPPEGLVSGAAPPRPSR